MRRPLDRELRHLALDRARVGAQPTGQQLSTDLGDGGGQGHGQRVGGGAKTLAHAASGGIQSASEADPVGIYVLVGGLACMSARIA